MKPNHIFGYLSFSFGAWLIAFMTFLWKKYPIHYLSYSINQLILLTGILFMATGILLVAKNKYSIKLFQFLLVLLGFTSVVGTIAFWENNFEFGIFILAWGQLGLVISVCGIALTKKLCPIYI